MSNPRQEPLYSIGAVSRMLQVPTPTLRAWEERYALVKPVRTEGSQRLYSRAQLEQLQFIKGQIESGVSAADAHRLLAEQLRTGPSPAQGPPSLPRHGQPFVLIAERDRYAAELAEHFLRADGYEVETALDAAEASRLFAERPPDVVIVDLLISGGQGFRLVSDFAQSGKAHVIAVAAIDAADQAKEAGAAAFITKPLDPRGALAKIRDLLATSAGSNASDKKV